MSDHITSFSDQTAAALSSGAELSERKLMLSRQINAWKRHSKLIKSLRLVFPGLIILLIALIFGWILVKTIINSLNSFDAKSTDIRMTNLHYVGQTNSGETFEVSGLEAVVKSRTSDQIFVKVPSMTLHGDDSRPSHLDSQNGVFNRTTKLFDVSGHVVFSGGLENVTMKTESAHFDLNTDTISGHEPVDAQWDKGDIKASSFQIRDRGNLIDFYGKPDQQIKGVINP